MGMSGAERQALWRARRAADTEALRRAHEEIAALCSQLADAAKGAPAAKAAMVPRKAAPAAPRTDEAEIKRRVEAEVERRVQAEIDRRLDLEVAKRTKKLTRELIRSNKTGSPFTRDQYVLVLRALHSDTAHDVETRNRAFQLFKERELQLYSTLDRRPHVPLPKTAEEMMARKKKR
jgi:hypothetical protein